MCGAKRSRKGVAAALEGGFRVAGMAMKASIASALAGGAAAAGAGIKVVIAAADFGRTGVVLTAVIGDAAKAEERLGGGRELGVRMPVEFPGLADVGRKLIAFGESADTVPETFRRIGDVSAGVQAPVGELTGFRGSGVGAPFQGSGVLCMVVPGRCPGLR